MVEEVRREAEAVGIAGEDIESILFGVKLALEEALVNHLKHGNQLDPDKIVTCEMTKEGVPEGSRVVFESADEGPGFDPADVPDPTAEENLERTCGRGLLLMRGYAETVEYLGNGNRVRMSFVLRKSEVPAAVEG